MLLTLQGLFFLHLAAPSGKTCVLIFPGVKQSGLPARIVVDTFFQKTPRGKDGVKKRVRRKEGNRPLPFLVPDDGGTAATTTERNPPTAADTDGTDHDDDDATRN